MRPERGPIMGDDGRVYVRVSLSRADRALLARVVAEGLAQWEPETRLPPDIADSVAEAAVSAGPMDLPACVFGCVGPLLSTARVRAILGEPDAVDVTDLAAEVERAGRATAPSCGRRRSDPWTKPRPSFRERVPDPTEDELLECGWRDADQYRALNPGGYVDRYDPEDLAALEYVHLHGQCAPLAIAVHDETGWQIVGLRMPWESKGFSHVACRTPDGLYVDARGDDLTADEIVAGYYLWDGFPPEIVEMTRAQALRSFRRAPAQHAAARESMGLLLPDLRTAAVAAP